MIEKFFSERNTAIVYILLFIIEIVILRNFYFSLPDKIATHFGNMNNPDGFSDKFNFILIYNVFLFFLILMFYGINIFIKKSSNSMINVPKKEYWLAPERRDITIVMLQANLNFFGIITFIFMLVNLIFIIDANLSSPIKLNNDFWIALMLFLVSTMAWLIRLLLVFSKVEEDEEESKSE